MSGTNFVFNVAKGRINEYVNRVDANDPANSVLVWVLLEATGLETDAVLMDKDTLADLVSGTTNEATFPGYTRLTQNDSVIGQPTIDDTANTQNSDAPDPSFTVSAGGGNLIAKLVCCYDSDSTGGADSAIIPLVALSYDVTPDPTTLIPILNGAGFFSAG